MRITATQIQQWADTRDAQGTLPILIRKLIVETSKPTELAMPGGDSVGQPGWDGVLTVVDGNAWVPTGASRWEMGCDKDVSRKAEEDFKKRTVGHKDAGADSSFVFVSPRRWSKKQSWRGKVKDSSQWLDVRALDADDLEAWLEIAPATTLWLGALLGLTGAGIQSVESYWEAWRTQSRIPLSIEAISAGRESTIQAFREALSKIPTVFAIEADSTGEAAAFACAMLVTLGQPAGAACITHRDGWHYVDTNPQLRILVATSQEIAAARAPKDGQMLIVPTNIGDRSGDFSRRAEHPALERTSLRRPDADRFEKALVEMGEDKADAARYARSTGRSWSVYRRRTAANPAVAHPAWVNDSMARVLTSIVLVGGWNDSRQGDIVCLEAVTGKKYEELESELRYLISLDDSPVVKIGHIWKAKAPLELLYLYAREISGNELTRYFATVEAILAKPDPALELDADKRWMASVYGKVRNESGIVIDSLVDSLVKLSVYAELAQDDRIAAGVTTLIEGLLDGADGERWLSLSGVLQELAEAAPETFLSAIEKSLRRDDTPIGKLFTEGNGDLVFGRNWHTDLLWALEILAWSPRNLARVADILAQLDRWPVQQNLLNRPMNTLISLFRPWWPQTTASDKIRMDCIDRVLQRHNEVGWNLLSALWQQRFLSASANAKPHWRDDDAGAPAPGIDSSVRRFYAEIVERAIVQAAGKATRIAKLIDDFDNFSPEHRHKVINLVGNIRPAPDADLEVVRTAIRKYIGWHNTYNEDGQQSERIFIDSLRRQFDALASANIARRHAWLFENGWVILPDGRAKDHEEETSARELARQEAVHDVFESEAWTGLTELARLAGDPALVGWSVARLGSLIRELSAWALERFSESGNEWHNPLVSGVLHGLGDENRAILMREAAASLPPEDAAAFLSAAPFTPATWNFVESCGDASEQAFWGNIRPQVLFAEGDDLRYCIDSLIQVRRHRTAFVAAHVGPNRGDPDQLLVLLEGIAAGEDSDGPLPDGWHIGEAIKRIAAAQIIPRRQLARLEFAYFRALEHGKGTPNLYAELLSQPAEFMECIALVFRASNAPSEPIDESRRASAEIAWHVLHGGRGVPGRRDDDSVDEIVFDEWISAVRKLAADADRRDITDITIGEWLSACPSDPDGKWPCGAVCELLEREDAAKIRQGFEIGVLNNRGVHGRALDAGGASERKLADHYRNYAKAFLVSHPATASALESIAKSYDLQAVGEDNDANLIREGVR